MCANVLKCYDTVAVLQCLRSYIHCNYKIVGSSEGIPKVVLLPLVLELHKLHNFYMYSSYKYYEQHKLEMINRGLFTKY